MQNLTVTIVSYFWKVRIAVAAEKDFIDSPLFIACMKKSFKKLYETAVIDKENWLYQYEYAKQK